jgi:hypothetical protein
MTSSASVVGVVLAVSCAVADTGYAQSPDAESNKRQSSVEVDPRGDTSQPEGSASRIHRKIRRLRIAGWSFVGSGAATFGWFLVWPYLREDEPSEAKDTRYFLTDISLPVVSAGLLTIGGALLLRARLVEKRHKRSDQASVSVDFTGTGARLQVRF